MHDWINFQKLLNRCRAVDVTLSRALASCDGMQRVSETCFCVGRQIGTCICLNTKIKLFLKVCGGVEVYL